MTHFRVDMPEGATVVSTDGNLIKPLPLNQVWVGTGQRLDVVCRMAGVPVAPVIVRAEQGGAEDPMVGMLILQSSRSTTSPSAANLTEEILDPIGFIPHHQVHQISCQSLPKHTQIETYINLQEEQYEAYMPLKTRMPDRIINITLTHDGPR